MAHLMERILLATAIVTLEGCAIYADRPSVGNDVVEISREECVQKVKNAGQPFRPGSQCSLELLELIEKFLLLDRDMSLSWDVAADPKTPIVWKTAGREVGCDGAGIAFDSPERCGEIFVTENGVIDHTVLENTIQPGVWSIQIYGSNAGVNKIEFEANSDIGLAHAVESLMKDNTWRVKKIATKDPWYGATLREDLYELDVPGKRKAWLKDEMSCGVSGSVCSFTLTIFHLMDEATTSLQYRSH